MVILARKIVQKKPKKALPFWGVAQVGDEAMKIPHPTLPPKGEGF
jgi:hypothetical protein